MSLLMQTIREIIDDSLSLFDTEYRISICTEKVHDYIGHGVRYMVVRQLPYLHYYKYKCLTIIDMPMSPSKFTIVIHYDNETQEPFWFETASMIAKSSNSIIDQQIGIDISHPTAQSQIDMFVAQFIRQ